MYKKREGECLPSLLSDVIFSNKIFFCAVWEVIIQREDWSWNLGVV